MLIACFFFGVLLLGVLDFLELGVLDFLELGVLQPFEADLGVETPEEEDLADFLRVPLLGRSVSSEEDSLVMKSSSISEP